MRLIQMRIKNPKDIIYLAFDSSLLNRDALLKLKKYCHEYSLIPIDTDSLEFKQQLTTPYEKKLYFFYKDEINNLNDGGNLAVASDILRWLSPIYKLGTYTDFDFPVDTTNLTDTINVKSALLLNIGNTNFCNKAFLLSNNDFIAVVNPDAAQLAIQQIQSSLIKKLKVYDTNYIEKIVSEIGNNFLTYKIFNYFKKSLRKEAIYIEKSKYANKEGLSSRQLRAFIQEIMQDKQKFLNFYKTKEKETTQDVIIKLRLDLKTQLTFIKWLFFQKEFKEIKTILAKNDNDLINYLMNKEKGLYLKSIVICTTGPIEISNALFKNYLLNYKVFIKTVLPLSFNSYGLQKSFQSKNSIPINQNILAMFKFLGTNDGDYNDSSWLDEGITLQKEREQKILVRQEELFCTLSYKLHYLYTQIKQYIKQLESSKTIKCLKIFKLFKFKIERKIYILQQTLECFDNANNYFNILKFQVILREVNQTKKKFANIFPNKFYKIIITLHNLSDDAYRYNLTLNKKIYIIKPSTLWEKRTSYLLVKKTIIPKPNIQAKFFQQT